MTAAEVVVGREPMTLDVVLDRLRGIGAAPHRSGAGWMARCPLHDDDNPSMSIKAGDSAPVVAWCYACRDHGDRGEWFARLLARLEDPTPLPPASPSARHGGSSGGGASHGTRVALYVYADAAGTVVARKVRYDDGGRKSFGWERPYGDAWAAGLARTPVDELPLYRLPELLAADPTATVYVVEGEKDADNAAAAGMLATTSGGGAGGKLPADVEVLRGRDVVVVADNDRPGHKHARAWEARLAGIAASVRLALPAVDTDKADLSDHLAAGLGPDDLRLVAANEKFMVKPNEKFMVSEPAVPVPDYTGDDAGPVVAGQSEVAEFMLRMNPGKFMFVPGIGFYVYDGRRWDQGNGEAHALVAQAVVAAARAMIVTAAEVREPRRREELLRLGHRTLSSSTQVAGVVDFVELHPDVLVTADRLNADPFLLNVQNGTLDLTTGVLRPHDPADRITRVAGAPFDPAARGSRWERFLVEALGDPALVAAVARCFGGCALPGIVRDHVLPIVHGPGGAGKGTFVETIAAALGDYAIAAEPELLMATRGGGAHPTGQMDLLGARLAFVSETDDGRRMAAATMKRLTGGDTIRARKMRQDFVQFRPSHLLVLVTNHLPTMPAGDDPAVWRRVRVVPFVRVPDKPDKRLPEQLRAELPGILAWLVAGLRDYTAHGDDAAWPEAVTTATSAYRGRSDVLGSFLADATVEAPTGATVPTGALYAAWKTWLEANAPDVRPGRTGDFVARLKDRGENVVLSSDKGARTVVRGRRLVAVSDVWDVSTPLPEIESSRRDNAGETSETSQTSQNTTTDDVCTVCSGPLYRADILAGDTTCSTCLVAS